MRLRDSVTQTNRLTTPSLVLCMELISATGVQEKGIFAKIKLKTEDLVLGFCPGLSCFSVSLIWS